jgi:hypothetical protein
MVLLQLHDFQYFHPLCISGIPLFAECLSYASEKYAYATARNTFAFYNMEMGIDAYVVWRNIL